MTDITKTANEYFLTQAQFNARKQAGTLEVGAIYHITDAETPKKYYVHKIDYAGPDGYFSLRFLSTKSSAISNTEFFTEQFTAGFLNGWAYTEGGEIYVVTNVECDPDDHVHFYSGELEFRDYSTLSEPIQDTYIEL